MKSQGLKIRHGAKMAVTREKTSFGDTTVPVVVLYTYHYGQVGVLRSLGRLGIAVNGIDPNPRSPGLFSRYCKRKFLWDVDGSPPQASVQYLLDIAKKIGKRSLLIHTTDNGAAWLADHADALSEGYIFPRLSQQLVRALASKEEMYFLAKKCGIPTPEACFPLSRSDVEEYVKDAIFPVVLKEIYRGGSPRTGKRMFVARTKAELLRSYSQCEDPSNPNFMLQEYIPGGDDSIWMFNGYFNEKSECLFGMTGKKIRQSPVHTGVTSLGVCLRNPVIDQMTKGFMKSIGYKGILDIGYRYDMRDGKYKVLDVNPRIGSTFRLFVGNNGLDVARAEYLDLTGQSVPSSEIVEGRKWFVEDRDLVSSIRYHYEKSLTFRQWITSFRGVQESAWFAWDDLSPFFVMCARSSRKMLSKTDNSTLNPYRLTP
jgi:predicted ATP-grasp superfamily ATP-dependent carboligase